MSNTKVVQTGTQKFVWNDFNMPILTSNGTINNTNYTYACAFKGSGGTTAGNVYNAFNNNTANYFEFTGTDTDTRVLVFFTPYKLRVNKIAVTASCPNTGKYIKLSSGAFIHYGKLSFYYYPLNTSLPTSISDVEGSSVSLQFEASGDTNVLSTTTKTLHTSGNWSNYHCFSFYCWNNYDDKYYKARIHNIVLYGKYQDGYQPTSGTADFTKPAYSVVKDGNIYKAIL